MSGSGGALAVLGSSLEATGTVFAGNEAQAGGLDAGSSGGAVDVMLAAGDVVVDFALVDDAVACLAALKFKRLCGAQLSVEFLEGNRE